MSILFKGIVRRSLANFEIFILLKSGYTVDQRQPIFKQPLYSSLRWLNTPVHYLMYRSRIILKYEFTKKKPILTFSYFIFFGCCILNRNRKYRFGCKQHILKLLVRYQLMQNTMFMPRRPNENYNILILFSEFISAAYT